MVRGSRKSHKPSESEIAENLGTDMEWRANWRGLDHSGEAERAKQMLKVGGRKPAFHKPGERK